MSGSERRAEILRTLRASEMAVTATALAAELGVSRQIIVGDIALLRAAGEDIMSTPRGYYIIKYDSALVHTLACVHGKEDTEAELNAIVDNGCEALNVTVEHPIYGQLTGALNLRSRYDVERFMERLRAGSAEPLSLLTGGLHLHDIACPDEEAFTRVRNRLDELGMLYKQE
ncbi:MAG: transcription repressor NadR [Oscillospiraceae bacterium]|nr:transcription repressor NadR [Oscillospiraceae bacterium]